MDNTDSNNPNQPSNPVSMPPAGANPSNPWDTLAAPTAVNPVSSQLPDPMSIASTPAPEIPAQSPWPAAPAPEAPSATAPATPANMNAPQTPSSDPLNSNPFLQGSAASITPFGSGQPASIPPTDPSQLGNPQPAASVMPQAPESPTPTPPADPASMFQQSMSQATPPQQDPLNTAFTPTTDPNAQNPFNQAPAPAGTVAAVPTQSAPAQSAPDFLNPPGQPEQPQNPVADMGTGSSVNTNSNETPNQSVQSDSSFGQSNSAPNQAGTIDLSTLQANGSQTTDTQLPPSDIQNPPAQPPQTPLPDMGPVENAPTDLSHLIAGDAEHQTPSEIYTPPVAQDQTPSLSPTQPAQDKTATDGAPPEKHLNLTKVLLVAGIPIVLIVAALSAYMILGIGKPAPQTQNTTSLPIETQQAPLTNPPSQVANPSPVTLPDPSPASLFPAMPESTTSGSTLPGSSPSPLSAIEQLKARQASPSPASRTP